MGGVLSSLAERISRFSCKSSCMISDGEKELVNFKKSLSMSDFLKIKEMMEQDEELTRITKEIIRKQRSVPALAKFTEI